MLNGNRNSRHGKKRGKESNPVDADLRFILGHFKAGGVKPVRTD